MANETNNIVCENCNTMYRYDAARIPPSGRKVRCSTCGHIFMAMPKAKAPTPTPSPTPAPAPSPSPNPRVSAEIELSEALEDENEVELDNEEDKPKKPAAPPPAEKKKRLLLRQDGTKYAVADIATLQRWIVERRVSKDAEISLDGETWEKVTDRVDLSPFFSIVERSKARKTRAVGTGDTVTSAVRAKAAGPAETSMRSDLVSKTGAEVALPKILTETPRSGQVQLPSSKPAGADATKGGQAQTARPAAPVVPMSSPAPAITEKMPIAAPVAPVAPAVPVSLASEPKPARPPVPPSTSVGALSPQKEAPTHPPAGPAPVPAAARLLYGVGGLILFAAAVYVFLRPQPPSGPVGEGPAITSEAAQTPAALATTPGPGQAVVSVLTPAPIKLVPEAPVTPKPVKVEAPTPKPPPVEVPTPKPPKVEAPTPKPPKVEAPTPKPPKQDVAPVPVAAKPTPTPTPAPTATEPKLTGNVSALLKQGEDFLRKEKYSDAVAAFRKAASISPDNSAVQNGLGWALYTQAQVDYRNQSALRSEAIRAFEKAIAANSRFADAYYGLGVVYLDVDKKEQAAKNLSAALKNGLKGKDNVAEVQGLLSRLKSEGYSGE